jgi:hypothetical protein
MLEPGKILHRPMPLVRIPEPFDHPDWLFELKHDGFRALAYVEGHRCRLVSRRGHTFAKWDLLCEEIAHSVTAMRAVLDGELVCLGDDGRAAVSPPAVPARLAVLLRVRSAGSRRRGSARSTAIGPQPPAPADRSARGVTPAVRRPPRAARGPRCLGRPANSQMVGRRELFEARSSRARRRVNVRQAPVLRLQLT